MRLSDDLRTNIDVINQLNVKNDKEELIPLSSLININTKQLASVIKRYDRQKQVTVGTDMKDGLALDTLINLVVENKDKWLLDGVTYTFEGDAKDMQDTWCLWCCYCCCSYNDIFNFCFIIWISTPTNYHHECNAT